LGASIGKKGLSCGQISERTGKAGHVNLGTALRTTLRFFRHVGKNVPDGRGDPFDLGKRDTELLGDFVVGVLEGFEQFPDVTGWDNGGHEWHFWKKGGDVPSVPPECFGARSDRPKGKSGRSKPYKNIRLKRRGNPIRRLGHEWTRTAFFMSVSCPFVSRARKFQCEKIFQENENAVRSAASE